MNAKDVRVTGSDVDSIESISEFERQLVQQIDAEVMDPHIPVSLVEMGMIYDVHVDDQRVTIEMTYPCLGCPAYGMIQEDIKTCLREIDGVEEVSIEVVWDPVWSKDRIDEEVQQKLQESGTAI